ncbi:MAG: hypothetical protein R3F35_06460 [Myxococcota bacterium]
MTWSLERLRSPDACERLIREINAFISGAYDRANTIARRNYVYEFTSMETFAFALHCPGSPETRHLPGFADEELPQPIAELAHEVADRLGLKRGRVLFNVGRYFERCGPIVPHYDGELFDHTVVPRVRHRVHSGIRPRQVAILTLRDDTTTGGTRLHDAAENEITPPMRVGDLLVFDNTLYRHSVPDPVGPSARPSSAEEATPFQDGSARGRQPTSKPRWLRYTLGWRSLDEACFDWREDEPLRPLSLADAVVLHERFLSERWPDQIESDLARATFPFPERYA